MNNIKQLLLIECKKILQSTLENVQSEMNEAQLQANEYGAPKDRYDAFRTQMMRKRDMFAQQTQKTIDDIAVLDRISSDSKIDKVSFGAVVKTSGQNIFVSVGLGKIILDDVVYYAISPAVPIFKVMQGLKKGDKYSFQGKDFEILDIA